ncbi:DUF6463 family protein [Maricurvus nonylphenolicus]|uniref:DUF6463 family protein n=1 Tax=Maricurvus nonylphenolicus TaxID=1008307 RepID=UPI0036F41055
MVDKARHWISYWIITVALLHLLFALIKFKSEYLAIVSSGLWNSVDTVDKGQAVWFFLFGLVFLVVGCQLYTLEKLKVKLTGFPSLMMLMLAIMGTVLMPVSGFWLVLPPAIAMFIYR